MEQTILFNLTKKELGSPATNFKKLLKKYKSSYKIGLNKEEITNEKIGQSNLLIFASPQQMFL